MLDELKEGKNSTDSNRLFVKSDGTIFNFNVFKSSLDFASDILMARIHWKRQKIPNTKCLSYWII